MPSTVETRWGPRFAPFYRLARWLYHAPEAVWGGFLSYVGEQTHGITTRGNLNQEMLGITESLGNPYIPSPWGLLAHGLGKADVSPDDVFLDFGSGKGRILFEAAHYPFKRIIGVEISEDLNRVARANIEAKRSALACQDVEIVCSEATAYQIPDDVTVAYFFNPFEGETFRRVMRNLQASIARHPRRVRIIYYVARMHEEVLRAGFEVVRQEGRHPASGLVVYQHAADSRVEQMGGRAL